MLYIHKINYNSYTSRNYTRPHSGVELGSEPGEGQTEDYKANVTHHWGIAVENKLKII